jgi:cytochrome c553
MRWWGQPLRRLWAAGLIALGVASPATALGGDDLADRLKACTGCHGDQGRAGPDGYYPRIAGKPEGYLLQQLLHFRDGRRQGAAMRWMVQGLSDASLQEIASHFGRQHPPYPPPASAALRAASEAGPERMARGAQLALRGDAARELPACADCHGQALTGVAPSMPGLLGLPRDYLNAQLGAWRHGERRAAEPDCMAPVARALSLEDLTAVTTWLAAQPVPGAGRPARAQTDPAAATASGAATASSPAMASSIAPASAQTRCGLASGLARSTGSVVGAEPSGAAAASIEARGAYLAKVGNCAGCHSVPGGAPYAGGKAIATPFGTVYGSNLTPHATGLGAWSAEDFWRALRHGRSRDGRALNPAFPYTSYSVLTREDSDALFAWLRTLVPIDQQARPPELRFPWNLPGLIRAWQWLFFRPQSFVADPAQSTDWNRGAYLVQGLGHCGACHTPRNALGAPRARGEDRLAFSGAELIGQGWYAPSLRSSPQGGVGHWPIQEIERWLATGRAPGGQANGPMARIVSESLSVLTPTDRRAMAVYLQSLSADPVGGAIASGAAPGLARKPAPGFVQDSSPGAKTYREHCADCHGDAGEGRPPLWPALADQPIWRQPSWTNATRLILHGGFGADLPGEPVPAGMPPFAGVLSDLQVAQLLRWMAGGLERPATGSVGDRARSEPSVHQVNLLRSLPLD